MAAIGRGVYDFGTEMILVTCGARGMGAGIAEVLTEAGATVVIADIAGDMAEAKATTLVEAGFKADHVQLNLADEASIITAYAKVTEKHRPPWGLVNNA